MAELNKLGKGFTYNVRGVEVKWLTQFIQLSVMSVIPMAMRLLAIVSFT
jgi:hypothetical protein